MIHYKFNENANNDNLNNEILENPKKWLDNRMTGSKFNFGVNNLTSQAVYRQMGWAYDFRDYLKKYVYQKYGTWSQVYALNKTNVRKLIGGKINKIIEVI